MSARVPRDPVRVAHRVRWSTVELDLWPNRLSAEGIRRVRVAYRDALGRRRQLMYGASGGFCDRVERDRADDLSDELRRIAFDPACVEEVSEWPEAS